MVERNSYLKINVTGHTEVKQEYAGADELLNKEGDTYEHDFEVQPFMDEDGPSVILQRVCKFKGKRVKINTQAEGMSDDDFAEMEEIFIPLTCLDDVIDALKSMRALMEGDV